MFTGAEAYGVGIDRSSKMASFSNGLISPEQAYQAFSDGTMTIKQPDQYLGKEEFTPEKPEKEVPTPIFTKNGRRLVALVILGFGAYILYKKWKSEKELNEAQVEPSDQSINNESTTKTHNEPIPAPQETPTVKSTAPTDFDSQLGE